MSRTVAGFALFTTLVFSAPVAAQVPPAESLTFDSRVVPGIDWPLQSVRLSARLHMPAAKAQGRVPAMVIVNSSGGVSPQVELYYARELADNGIAGLVVDSFGPRGVKSTVDDQARVTTWQMENDAFAALTILRKDPRIDPARIGVMGLSKGGVVSMQAAMRTRQAWRRTGGPAFALHVAIAPDCHIQHEPPATTGVPMLLLLGELDDYTVAKPCIEYAERIRVAGHQSIRVIVYPGAHHGWEWAALEYLPDAVKLVCRATIGEDGAYTFPEHGRTLQGVAISKFLDEAGCFARGAHVGGGSKALKRQATMDLLNFLKSNGF